MAVEINAYDAPQAYVEGIQKLKVFGVEEQSRNGPVLTIQEPVVLTIKIPTRRVIFDPFRDANPFFHLMEAIWMMAGSNDVRFVEQFNKKYREYAENGADYVHAAYGHRWRKAFSRITSVAGHPKISTVDQVKEVIELLKKDPTSRRAVLGMWDPGSDLVPHNDLPCNTHIYFRIVNGALEMTVCNRSNDFVWGMLGANVVHMTILQELVAHGAGVPIGHYRVMTNNLHIYKGLDKFGGIINTVAEYNPYLEQMFPLPLLAEKETVDGFLNDCEEFIEGRGTASLWFKHVAWPMLRSWKAHKDGNKEQARFHAEEIGAPDWRIACVEWLNRRK